MTYPENSRLNARALNALILDTHRAGWEAAYPQFRSRMLKEVCALIPFDSAWWASAAADQREIHHPRLYNCDEEILRDYPPFIPQDFFRAALVARPGETINLSDLTSRGRFVRTALYRQFCRRYRIEWPMGTLLVEPATSTCEFLILWRHDPRRPFSEAERQAKELLMPHLVHARRVARLRSVRDATKAMARAWALTDERGYLREVTPGFVHSLRAVYPDWQGSRLPAPLLPGIRAGSGFALGELRVAVTSHSRFRYLEIRALCAFDRLTSREAAIARRYARGETHGAIASSLGISGATVRNHLAHCYRKLGVSNKAELLQRVLSAGQESL